MEELFINYFFIKFMEELFINYFFIKFVGFFFLHILAQLTLFLFYLLLFFILLFFFLSVFLSFSLESQSTDDQDKCLKVLYQEMETLFHKIRRYVS